jgi:hypothetical protein
MLCSVSKTSVIESVTVAAVVAIALILQSTVGDVPLAIFAFPLNIAIIVLWLVIVGILYKNRSNLAVAKSLLSIRATWLSLGSMVATGIYLGLEREPSSTSWLVVVGILFTLTHLLLITLRGWRTPAGIRWRFTLLHVGLILALGAGFWGAPDREQLRMALVENKPTETAYHINGTATRLDHAITLRSLNAEYNESGMPTYFDATLEIENESVTLRVNHPYNKTLSEKIYLVSVGQSPDNGSPYCVVEIVREPWQWFSLAGIVMLLAGAVMLFIRGPRHAANKQIE